MPIHTTSSTTCRFSTTPTSRRPCRNASSFVTKLMPVILPLGRARLETRPSLTGSSLTENTMGGRRGCGFERKSRKRVSGGDHPTWRRTRSVASAGRRSIWFSAQRNRMVTLSPSTKPASFRPWRNPRRRSASVPATGCKETDHRHGAAERVPPRPRRRAPPSSVMNSRRITRSPRRRGEQRRRHVEAKRLAVLRLIINSYFVGCTTGRSAGLAPLRICPA